MQFANEIQHLFLGTLIAFAIVGLSATYWAITGRDTILLRDDNPRIIEEIARIQRGSIYDRDEELLVQTETENGVTSRRYLHESTYSTLGYYSLRYGEGGAEFAFNDTLARTISEENLSDYFEQSILNVPTTGADIQLTLDLKIQTALTDSLINQQGAGVVLDAQTGEILALASLPTYDPNTLDDNWDSLTQAIGDPFFNRALQGQYQPGGVMYTLWMAQALLTEYDTTQLIANADDTVALGADTLMSCAIDPPESNLNLLQGYVYGCPVPFAVYSRTTSDRTFDDLVQNFSLDNALVLDRFPIPETISPTSGTQVEIDPILLGLRDTLGQGNITVTPLHIAGVLSAIVHNGNAQAPTILKAIRQPDSDIWEPVNDRQPSTPMMTSATARQLQTTLRDVWQTIQTDTYPEAISVGATVATSQSGTETQSWLIGFVRHEQGTRIAFVILLEDTKDIQTIISAGKTLIQVIIEDTVSSQS